MSDKKYYDAQLDRARQLQNEGLYGKRMRFSYRWLQ